MTPRVDLHVETMFCPRHLEPFRAEWPKGVMPAMLTLFEVATAMTAVIDAAGADANNLTVVLQQFRPVCCFVPAGHLAAAYAAGGVTP